MKLYKLDDYNQITFDGILIKLPDRSIDIIKNLTKEIEIISPSSLQLQVSSDDRSRKSSLFNNNKRGKNRKNETFEDLSAIRNFKTTVIEKKEGTEKVINDIRTSLNKISSKNYEKQRDVLVSLIKEAGFEEKDEMEKIANSIYDVASNNKFNSIIYANLFKELATHFIELNEFVELFIERYNSSIDAMYYVDQNSDYDKYCEYNKSNDKRKALSNFLSNMTIIDFVSKDKIMFVILNLLKLIDHYVEEEGKTNEVDEITENVFIFITTLNNYFHDYLEWQIVIETVYRFSKMKSKEKKSLSSRAVFKYMDLLDAIKTK